MRIVERVERNGPDKPHRSLPPFKLAISAGILIVGLIVAGLLAPTSGLMWASFALAWGALLWLMMIGGAFVREARRNNGGGKN